MAQSLDATSAPATPPKAAKKSGTQAQPDVVERALDWLRRTGFQRTAAGRAAAARLVASMPKRFSGLTKEVAAMQKRVEGGYSAMGLDERRRNLVQLWKLRGSLDLLALLEPRMLHALTGLDVATLTDLTGRLTTLRKSLGY